MRAVVGSCPLLTALLVLGACGPPTPAVEDAARDAAVDASSPCLDDSDCDDGLVCDGIERCASGTCVGGERLRCDDGVPCTVDACSEALRGCRATVPDLDGDGAGDLACRDAMGASLGADCDDTDANRFPGNPEVCDASAHDEDCQPTTLGGTDFDGDGHPSARCCNGAACGEDCDDVRADVGPDGIELCNLVDDDCDGSIDEGVGELAYADLDRDGYGAGAPTSNCASRVGFSAYDTDCADDDVARSPGQAEFCDGVDNDCDTVVDESAAAVPWYRDRDGDRFGSARSGIVTACVPPAGYSLLATDCDDSSAARSPVATELCDGLDSDCSGTADFLLGPGDTEDDDRDGVADSACAASSGLDCDDRDPTTGPGEAELCDGVDNDCDGHVDEGATRVAYYRDVDGDTFGAEDDFVIGCSPPSGYVRRGGDCADTDREIAPGVPEACDGADQDCDGAIDEGGASCALPNASSVCVARLCEVGACASGFGDCTSAPGCESDLRSDPLHCGACTPCAEPASSCSAGRCAPTLARLDGVVTSSLGAETITDVVAVPGTNDLIVVGSFTGQMTLRGAGTRLTSRGGRDGFAARLLPTGDVLWGEQWGGTGDDAMTSVALSSAGRLMLGGTFCDTMSLCGGPVGRAGECTGFWQASSTAGTVSCDYAEALFTTAGTTEVHTLAMEVSGGVSYVYVGGVAVGSGGRLGLATTAFRDGFVARFREVPGSQPTLEWVRMATAAFDDSVEDLALDASGHVIAVGTTTGSVDFGLGPRGFAGFSDPYFMVLASGTGVALSGAAFGTPDGYDTGQSVQVAGSSLFVTGAFGTTGSALVVGPNVVPSQGLGDAYVAAFDVLTGAGQWAFGFGGAGDDVVLASALLDGGPVVCGGFSGRASIGGATFDARGEDSFVLALTPSGAVRWARQAGGPLDDQGVALAVRSDGHLVWATTFQTLFEVMGSTLVGDATIDVALAELVP